MSLATVVGRMLVFALTEHERAESALEALAEKVVLAEVPFVAVAVAVGRMVTLDEEGVKPHGGG